MREMWDDNTGWKFEVFADYLPPSVLKEIISHDIVADEEVVDEVFWSGFPSGNFTIKSAIKIIRNKDVLNISQTQNWREIWGISVPQRVCFFIWLVVHKRLTTNGVRFLRRMTDDPRCFFLWFMWRRM